MKNIPKLTTSKAVPWLVWLVAGFGSDPLRVGFMVHEVALKQSSLLPSPEYISFPQSRSFCQFSILRFHSSSTKFIQSWQLTAC